MLLVAALFGSCSIAGASASPKAVHYSTGCTNGNRIALTFDDGPNPPFTGQILDILEEHHAAATFFVEGQAVGRDPDDVRRELAAANAIGSHSYAHSDALDQVDRNAFADDLERAEQVIKPVVGFTPGLYRAPYGHTSDAMLRELRAHGYVSIGWDIDARDWSDDPPDTIVRNVLENAHPGAIVLMHDGGLGGGDPDRQRTIAALPRIIDGLRAEGYELVTLPELIGVAEAQDAPRPPACSPK
jgi:peptidoglycan/xylan/chitin deacetylase (PgdA/CDA1 family)